ncbi:thiamine/thiamine pyrophosphate ABC transporter permease ThiP [Roseibacterium sp. SDUM158017]|uniref:thiamine/thiamine pyrophosphate ABC transporter permease ThiP n=1 Tax=Roseicyclus salinarum TaxID=3036773 RepID=UPI0024153F86|nr:thiamine/thiamine pyrophosphate ABC transporter permease ThiP [Roseibacterium sp. SDUM158017]MDG4647094.1 thiamine/thiamine pyrophosphate ABC transporter permease ThiP [Roseibacterium sp. SDUM158017]
MARRAQPLSGPARAGAALSALVALAVLGPLLAVALSAEGPGRLGPGDVAAIRFTLVQAVLSAFLSVAAAIPVARALARRRFAGRRLLVALMGAPFILPVIVAVLGLLAIFGRAGWLNAALEAMGAGAVSIYGLSGIVLAHVFLNLPLAVRLLLQAWLAVPSERMRLASSLGFSGRDMRRHFERPILKAVLPGAFAIIFLICASSFAVALILGGGPRATTVELAIYQAFRFDFDLGRAALLGVVQVLICLAAGLLALGLARGRDLGEGLDRPALPWPGDRATARAGDALTITAAALFLLLPLLAVVIEGVGAVAGLPPVVWAAALRSVLVALGSTAATVVLAVPIAIFAASRRGSGGVEAVTALSIAVSPLVVGTGLFLILFPIADPVALALPVTGFVNALVALPFVLRALIPAVRQAEAGQGRLADALGLTGWPRLRLAILPRLRRPLGFGAGLAAAFSMGDLGVIALFSSPGEATLPMEMYRLMGSYRTDDAQGAAVLLLLLALGLFWLFDRGGRVDAAA